jgi:hypothetical protein
MHNETGAYTIGLGCLSDEEFAKDVFTACAKTSLVFHEHPETTIL